MLEKVLQKAGKVICGVGSPKVALFLVVVWGITSIVEFRNGDYKLMTISLLIVLLEGCIFYSESRSR